MCGIAGAIGRPVSEERVRAALGTMGRRGPDGTGVFHGQANGHAVTLLHARLSIIDLNDRAAQPFSRDGLALAFNGEIYNYQELRSELEGLGHRFSTSSDTEVLLEAWREWGQGALDRMEGMWAFALLDTARGALILARDRFGEKPLHTMLVDGTLYFASEPKTLVALAGRRPTPDLDHLARYLVLGYKTLFKNGGVFQEIREIPSASLAEIDHPHVPVARRYWSLAYRPQPMTADEAEQRVRACLIRSLKLRLRADVPLAFCLSGGIDSTVLAGLATRELGCDVHAFSIVDADPRYDESGNIDAVVKTLNCRHHVVRPSKEGFLDRLADQTDYHDAPVATLSYYLHNFLSEAISRHGYKVAISGTAADELFTGYYDHYCFWLCEHFRDQEYPRLFEEWRSSYGQFVRNPYLSDPLRFLANPCERGHITLGADIFAALLARPFAEPFREACYSGNLLRNRMLNELFHESVPVLLREDDLNSMAWSVENRSPYLDRELAELAYSIPNRLLVRDGYMKALLRAAGRGCVPDNVRLDRQKKGFNGSILTLLDPSDPGTRDRMLADGPIFDLVDRDRFIQWLDIADLTDNTFSKFLFSFLTTRFFLDRHG